MATPDYLKRLKKPAQQPDYLQNISRQQPQQQIPQAPADEQTQIIAKPREAQRVEKNPDGTFTVSVGGQSQRLSAEKFADLQQKQRIRAEFGTQTPEVEAREQARPGIVQDILNLTASFRTGKPTAERFAQFEQQIGALLQDQAVPGRDEFGLTEEIGVATAGKVLERTATGALSGAAVGSVAAGIGAVPGAVGGAAIGAVAGVGEITVGLQADRKEAIRQSTQTAEKNNRFIQDTITSYESGQIDEVTAIANFAKAEQNYMQQRANLKAATVGYWGQDLTKGEAEEAKLNIIIDDILPLQKGRLIQSITNQGGAQIGTPIPGADLTFDTTL